MPLSTDESLEITDLSVRYRGGVHALQGVSAHVAPGECLAVMGRNGAGKSTFLRAIAGFLPSDGVTLAGGIRLGRNELQGGSPASVGALGVAYVPERDKVFPDLSVDEHFRLYGGHQADADLAIDTFPKLAALRSGRAGLLSGGERQMLALACAIIRRPRLLLVDELSLGLAPVAIKELSERLHGIQGEMRFSMIVVDMNRGVVDRLAERVQVLDHGLFVASGRPDEISDSAWLSSGDPAGAEQVMDR